MPEPTIHDRALELAVVALDFDLEPAERAWLDRHLAGCSACRQGRHAYAADARGLARLPQVSAPERVRARVLGSRGRPGPGGGSRRPWLASVAALGLVAAVGGALVLRPGAPPAGPGSSAALPTAAVASSTPPSTASSGASPGSPSASLSTPPPTTPPSPEPVAGPVRWQPLATPDQAPPRELRAFSVGSGIALAALLGANGEPRLWWSADGGAWSDAELPEGAFGGTAPFLIEPFGAGFVALGWTDYLGSDAERRIWLSPDGLGWHPDTEASGRFGPIQYGLLAASDALALAGGRSPAGETVVWRSTDGETWTQLEVDSPLRDADVQGIVASDDGFLAFGAIDGAATAWRTVDGARWEGLTAPSGLARVDGMSGVEGGLLAWGATAVDRTTSNALAWSADGAAWEVVTAPSPVTGDDQLVWIDRDRAGYVALWRRLDGTTVMGRSPDGRSWTAVAAEGLPAGVELDRIVRMGDRLIALGRDADGRVVSFTAAP